MCHGPSSLGWIHYASTRKMSSPGCLHQMQCFLLVWFVALLSLLNEPLIASLHSEAACSTCWLGSTGPGFHDKLCSSSQNPVWDVPYSQQESLLAHV